MAVVTTDEDSGRKPERDIRLDIICPCCNEAECIEDFHTELSRQLERIPHCKSRIIIVDDGSSDGTLEVLNRLAQHDSRVRVYAFSRNFGHQAALSAGLEAARGDAVVLMDSDLQHPPALIPVLVEKWKEGFDVVQAVREQTADSGLLKRFSSRLFYTVFNCLSETRIIPGAADFCLLSRPVYRSIRGLPERRRFLRGLVAWMGFRRAQIPFVAPARHAGISKYGPARMARLALDALLSFSTRPLRVATNVGLLIATLSALYFVYAVWIKIGASEAVRGWTSVICTILLLGGIQLVFIGVLGEYLARVLDEVKGRPQYVLKQAPARRSRRGGRVRAGKGVQ